MAISGEKMIDVLNALQDFICNKLPAITECRLTPAEMTFVLHHLAWVNHQKCEEMMSSRKR